MNGISVIIPTHNRKIFLERALISVVRQTLSCDEIIVIDDGSTDGTKIFIETFKQSCKIPVHYFFQKNTGPASARNNGITRAQFDYIAFLDSDDHWMKNKLKLQWASLFANPEIFISHTKEKWLRRGIHLNQKKIHQPGNGDIFRHCLQLCAVGMSTVMVKKKLFDEVGLFNDKLRCCEDYDLWLRTASRYRFLLIDTALTVKEGGREDQVSYEYRIGMDKLRISAIVDLLRREYLVGERLNWALEELEKKCHVYGNGCIKHGRFEEGERYVKVAIWAASSIGKYPNTTFELPEKVTAVLL